MSALPGFTVVITCYNYAEHVGAAIRSVLDQDYPAELVELIVVDDGSTDASLAACQAFAHEPQLRIIAQENRGQTAAFHVGVQAARWDYVALLDADDVFLPDKLRAVAQRIAELQEPVDSLFLCHDLALEDTSGSAPVRVAQSWFQVVGITRSPDCLTLDQPIHHFPFSVPCGLVFSRALLAACLDALPTWDFRRGADGILCPAALLKTGRVHYLRKLLGIYRIHGANEFASLVDGQYVPRFNPLVRTPKTLRHLEHWVDMLDPPAPQRALALDYLRRLEHLGRRLSASRRLAEPAVSVLGIAGPATPHGRFEASLSLQSHGPVDFVECPYTGTPELLQMAQAYANSSGEYVVFLRAGDRLDRLFVERHLEFRLHGPLVGVSCTDVRLVSQQDALVSADVLRNSGAWKQALQQVPPLATGLRDWVAPPMSACMFRRTAFLDRLFAGAQDMPADLQHAGFWLVFQLAHHTAGVLRILETLSSCRLPDGAGATYAYLSAPAGADATLLQAPVALAAQWLDGLYRQEHALFRQWLPAAWHQRFVPWLAGQANAAR